MTDSRFLTIFGLADIDGAIDGDEVMVVKVAVEAVRRGYAVVPLPPMSKKPTLCTLTARDRKAAGPDHQCGVHHAFTEPERARAAFTRMVKAQPGLGLGIVAHPSRLIVIDADNAPGVAAFKQWMAAESGDDGYLDMTPTVLTPGMRDNEGNWVHKDGGHYYFRLPDGVDLDLGREKVTDEAGYDIRWGWSMTAVPPTRRAEGPYVAQGNVPDAPDFLIARIDAENVRYTERRALAGQHYANDSVAAWSAENSWSDLLEPDGWHTTSKSDRCGCPIFEKPGGGSTSWKSATGHDNICDKYENVEGHGPLHIWTDDPPAPLDEYVRSSGKTITKLTYTALTRFNGSHRDAMDALGIIPDMEAWELPDATPVTPVTNPDALTDTPSGGRQDRQDSSGTTQAPSSTVSPPKDDDLFDPDDEDSSLTVGDAASHAMERYGWDPVQVPKEHEEIARMANATIKRRIADLAADIMMGTVPVSTESDWDIDDTAFVEMALKGVADTPPSVLQRTDGMHLLHAGKVNYLIGRRGTGKTMLSIYATMQVLEQGGSVMYFDMEDSWETFKGRFVSLGFDIDSAVVDGRLRWKRLTAVPQDAAQLERLVRKVGGYDLVVFDVINRMISMLGGSPDIGNVETLWLFNNIFDPIAGQGSTVLVLDHPNKAGQRADASIDELTAGGGAMRLNCVNGHVIAMKAERNFSRANPDGHVHLYCKKDRIGYFTENDAVGEFIGSTDLSDFTMAFCWSLRIDPPAAEKTPEQEAQDEVTEVANILYNKLAVGPMTAGALRPFITQTKRPYVDIALDSLVLDGLVSLDESGKYHRVNG